MSDDPQNPRHNRPIDHNALRLARAVRYFDLAFWGELGTPRRNSRPRPYRGRKS